MSSALGTPPRHRARRADRVLHEPRSPPGPPGSAAVTAYDWAFRNAAVRVDAEKAHRAGFAAIRAARSVLEPQGRRLRRELAPVRAMGLTFHGRLGLAAGFDKTPRAPTRWAVWDSPRRDRHRHRSAAARQRPAAVVPAAERRRHRQPDGLQQRGRGGRGPAPRGAGRTRSSASGRHRVGDLVLGVNIGRTKVVPEDQARPTTRGVRACWRRTPTTWFDVSSPNTPGLRDLQAVDKLQPLLAAVRRAADNVTAPAGRRVPLLVKIAPDLADDDVLRRGRPRLAEGLDGIIATKTTIGERGLRAPAAEVAACRCRRTQRSSADERGEVRRPAAARPRRARPHPHRRRRHLHPRGRRAPGPRRSHAGADLPVSSTAGRRGPGGSNGRSPSRAEASDGRAPDDPSAPGSMAL